MIYILPGPYGGNSIDIAATDDGDIKSGNIPDCICLITHRPAVWRRWQDAPLQPAGSSPYDVAKAAAVGSGRPCERPSWISDEMIEKKRERRDSGHQWLRLSGGEAGEAVDAGEEQFASLTRNSRVDYASPAQRAVGMKIGAYQWLQMESLTHAALPAVQVIHGEGLLDFASDEDAQVWEAVAVIGRDTGDLIAAFDSVILTIIRGEAALSDRTPSPIKYLILRALRHAREISTH